MNAWQNDVKTLNTEIRQLFDHMKFALKHNVCICCPSDFSSSEHHLGNPNTIVYVPHIYHGSIYLTQQHQRNECVY